jgi:hypothetical protein
MIRQRWPAEKIPERYGDTFFIKDIQEKSTG